MEQSLQNKSVQFFISDQEINFKKSLVNFNEKEATLSISLFENSLMEKQSKEFDYYICMGRTDRLKKIYIFCEETPLKLPAKIAKSLSEILTDKNCCVTELYLQNVIISDDLNQIFAAIKINESLIALSLSNHLTNAYGFTLNESYIQENQMQLLAEAVVTHPTLEQLDISGRGIGFNKEITYGLKYFTKALATETKNAPSPENGITAENITQAIAAIVAAAEKSLTTAVRIPIGKARLKCINLLDDSILQTEDHQNDKSYTKEHIEIINLLYTQVCNLLLNFPTLTMMDTLEVGRLEVIAKKLVDTYVIEQAVKKLINNIGLKNKSTDYQLFLENWRKSRKNIWDSSSKTGVQDHSLSTTTSHSDKSSPRPG